MELRARQRTGSRVFGVVFKIGDIIANRYRVVDIIGSGGAGVVYRAHDQEIDVDVAVKVINAKLVQTADEQRLFSRQTKIARKLSHQNVVRIYDEGRDEDRPFYTMQFLEGLSLRKIIDLRKEKEQTFALAEIEPIYNQLCQALEYAHKTTFHGNLKPDNVIVLPDLLKVTDFALLRGLPRKPFLAIQKSRAQNFRYLAPEVRLEVNELDRQVDMYSLGVILCEMLTGIVFDDAKPEQLSITGTGVDSALVGIIKRAVARAPKDRYLSAGELYEDLRSASVRGGTARQVRVPPSSGQPPHLAELPTQRLDITSHGPRPVQESSEPPGAAVFTEGQRAGRAGTEEETKDVRPPPGLEAAAVGVPDSAAMAAVPHESGTFATIDDDMIESAAPSSVQVRPELPESAPAVSAKAQQSSSPPPSVPEDSDSDTEALLPDEVSELPEAASGDLLEISNSAIELIADPRATNLIRFDSSGDVEYRGTVPRDVDAIPVPEVVDALPASAGGLRDEVTEDAAAAIEAEVPANRTLQPTPLPDSALPQPAFQQAAAREPTEYGRLDGAGDDVLAPREPSGSADRPIPLPSSAAFAAAERPGEETRDAGAVPIGAMAPAAREATAAIEARDGAGGRGGGGSGGSKGSGKGKRPRTIPRSPTAAMDVEAKPAGSNGSAKHTNGRSAKPRPMTRPRMSAAPSAATPVVLPGPEPGISPGALFDGTPAPDLLRKPTGARPLVVDGGSIKPQQSAIGVAALPAQPATGTNRGLLLTIGFSVLAVLVAFMIMFKLQSDRQSDQQAKQINDLQQRIMEMQNLAASAREKEATALAEAKGRAVAADEAQRAAEDAARAVKDAEDKRAAAEAEAKRREDDAKRLEEQARQTGDAKQRSEAETAARAASAEAVKQRQAAEAESKREREERAREERERKRREKEEQAQKLAEERAERERLAKQKAEEKAARLEAEREASSASKAKAEEERLAAAEAKREEAERKKAEEAERKAAEQKKREEEAAAKASAEEAAPVAAATGGSGTTCPMGMVLIDAGAFMMGAPNNDPERNFGDLPYASVEVRAFCVDYYEFPNGRGRIPQGGVSYKSALASCKKKNKRLCSEAEWEKACKGPSGARFPYGNQWDPTACATEDDEGNKREAQKSGEFKRCRSGFNVFDMSGNVAEWTSTEYGAGGYAVKGGAADRPGYDARCAARKKKKATDADALLGFRCCADPT